MDVLATAEKTGRGARGPFRKPANVAAFRPVCRITASKKVVCQICDLIACGRLKSGDRLPPERTLAEALGVGRPTVREAIRSMETLNWVDLRPGEGTFLRSPAIIRDRDPYAGNPFHTPTAAGKLYEVRGLLEPEVAALSAQRATPADLGQLRGALIDQEQQIGRGRSGFREDIAFHALIVAAAGNEILVGLMGSLLDLFGQPREEVILRREDALRSLERNETILEAIARRNPVDAERRVRQDLLWSRHGLSASATLVESPREEQA